MADISETTFSSQVIDVLKSWKNISDSKKIPLRIYLGVDIGGTNCRVALVNADEISTDTISGERYLLLCKFLCNSTKDLIFRLTLVGDQLFSIISTVPISACLDVAAPITNNGTQVVITNYVEKNLHINDLPTNLFPKNTIFINDLAAACEGILSLGEQNRLSHFFQPLWTPFEHDKENIGLRPVNYLVMAMGTGLGSCMMISDGNGNHFILPTENGHVSLTPYGPSHPSYDEEKQLIGFLSQKVYNGQHSIEWEDICSGRGLGWCYEFATRNVPNAEKLSAFEVVQKALASDELAKKALFLHYKYLFRVAQQQCIGLIAQGVFLAGDNQAANDPFVAQHIEEYKTEFLNHSKRDWIEQVPVYRQTKSYNLNLLGCLHNAAKRGK